MSNILNVPITLIDENPHRNLATYPTIEAKIDSLVRSIQDVGFWEGVIARPAPNSNAYQLAFGHHRLEAAKRAGLQEIPLVIRDLDDEQMLKFMGRENGEDYGTDFQVMLNTWEGAVAFLNARHGAHKNQPTEIAKFLGWVRKEPKERGGYRMSEIAQACNNAYELKNIDLFKPEDLQGLSVKAAREVVQQTNTKVKRLKKKAERDNIPKQEVAKAEKAISKGVAKTVKQVKEGKVAQKDIRAQVDINSFAAAATTKTKESPLFAEFGNALVNSLGKMLSADAASKKLREISKAVNKVTMNEDEAVLRALDFELSELGKRSEGWKKKLIPTSEKVIGLPALEKK